MTFPSVLDERLGIGLGYLLDRMFGEPPTYIHPLPRFGRMMARLERWLYFDHRAAGVAFLAGGLSIGFVTGSLMCSRVLTTYLACGGRALADAAEKVNDALRSGDVDRARAASGALVGRDRDDLGADDLARAAVESVAENTVDAVVGPLFYAAVAGAPGVLVYRAANTLDAIVGYHSARYERFGWASARFDDVLNYLPARLAAVLVIVVRPLSARNVVRIVRRDASAHPSPNAGVIESAFAAALGLQLGGTNSYRGIPEFRATMGDGRPAAPSDIARAIALSRTVGTASAITSTLISLEVHRRRRRSQLLAR